MLKILLTTDLAHDLQTVIFSLFYWNYFFDTLLFKLKICKSALTVYA